MCACVSLHTRVFWVCAWQGLIIVEEGGQGEVCEGGREGVSVLCGDETGTRTTTHPGTPNTPAPHPTHPSDMPDLLTEWQWGMIEMGAG